MTQIDLFNISEILPDFEAQFAEFKSASDRTRGSLRQRLDIAYGPAPRQRLDLFFPSGETRGRPIHMFIHGGYWRAQAKEDYVFVADGIVAAGAIAAVVEYTLIPVGRDGPVPGGARLADQVRELRQAARWLVDNAAGFGGDPARLSASGHSAGGHLVTYLASRAPHEPALPPTPVTAVMPISGLFDLRPIAESYLQADLHLSADEVAQWSPIAATPSATTQYEIVVGHDETAPFHQQAQDYAAVLARHGAAHERRSIAGEEHMSVLRQLGRVGSPIWRALAEIIARR